jgi:hypothetical protein
MRMWIRNTDDLMICGLGHLGNLRINHYKFVDLRICELAHPRNL